MQLRIGDRCKYVCCRVRNTKMNICFKIRISNFLFKYAVKTYALFLLDNFVLILIFYSLSSYVTATLANCHIYEKYL